MILALDLATTTGWAAAPIGTTRPATPLEARMDKAAFVPIHGAHRFAPKNADLGQYGWAFHDWIDELYRDIASNHGRPTLIVFESPIMPRQTSIATCRKLYGLALLTEMFARDQDIDVAECPRQTFIKHFCGHWTKEKRVVIDRCCAMGWNPVDDNAADALALLDWALATWHVELRFADKLGETPFATANVKAAS